MSSHVRTWYHRNDNHSEEGLITPRVPGKIKMEAPAGLVDIVYIRPDGKVSSVKLTNVGSFFG